MDKAVENETAGQLPEVYSAFGMRKIIIIPVVTLCGFLGPLAGNIYIPLIESFQNSFATSKQAINGTVSVFMFVLAFFPLLLSIVSDRFGRRPVLVVSGVIYTTTNILLATLPASIVGLYILRVFQAIGASNVAVGIGAIADISEPRDRARYISYYMAGPQLGPILGPMLGIAGAVVSWRICFVILAVLGFTSLVLVVFLLPETLRYLVGNGGQVSNRVFVKPTLFQKKIVNSRKYPKPAKPDICLYLRLCLNLPVLFCSVSGALAFSCFYAASVTYAGALNSVYSYNGIQICLSYLAPGCALIAGSMMFGTMSDKIRKNYDQDVGPEKRFIVQVVCLVPFFVSLILFGLVAEKHYHVSCLMVLSFMLSFSLSGILITNTTYLSELTRLQLASYVAFGNMLRNIGAAGFTAFIAPLVHKIGYFYAFLALSMSCVISLALSLLVLLKGSSWRDEAKASPPRSSMSSETEITSTKSDG